MLHIEYIEIRRVLDSIEEEGIGSILLYLIGISCLMRLKNVEWAKMY